MPLNNEWRQEQKAQHLSSDRAYPSAKKSLIKKMIMFDDDADDNDDYDVACSEVVVWLWMHFLSIFITNPTPRKPLSSTPLTSAAEKNLAVGNAPSG